MSSSASQQLAVIVAQSTFVEVARRLGCSEGSVRSWAAGKATPRSTIRRSVASEFGVPVEAWDEPPSVAETETLAEPLPAPADPDADDPSARSVLDAELVRLDGLRVGSADWAPRDKIALSTARAGVAARLAKFTGEEATDERRLLDSPAFRLVMRTVAETLALFPVPAAAVSAALRALDEKRTA